MAIIDQERLDNAVLAIERGIEKLTLQERLLPLSIVQGRINAQIQRQQMADLTASVPLGGLIKRVLRGNREEDGDTE
jgi:hypothetical protein